MDEMKKFQKNFVNGVVNGNLSEYLESKIIPVGSLNQKQVLQVYTNDYYARLTEALGESFEAIWAVLGDEEFFKVCHEYIKKYPSSYRELGELSENFPIFLEECDLQQEYPFILALANFEKDFWSFFHQAKELPRKDITSLSMEDFLSTRFKFAQNIKTYAWDYRVFALWKLRKEGLDGFEGDIDQDQNLILFKTTGLVEASEVSNAQLIVLHRLIDGRNIEEAIDEVDITSDEISSLFSLLRNSNLIVDF